MLRAEHAECFPLSPCYHIQNQPGFHPSPRKDVRRSGNRTGVAVPLDFCSPPCGTPTRSVPGPVFKPGARAGEREAGQLLRATACPPERLAGGGWLPGYFGVGVVAGSPS